MQRKKKYWFFQSVAFFLLAVVKAQEAGLDITEEDVLRKTSVSQIIDKNPPCLNETSQIKDILKIFSDSIYHNYPVVDADFKIFLAV